MSDTYEYPVEVVQKWNEQNKAKDDRIITLLAVIEQCEKALALVEFSFKDETGFMSARGQIFQNKITNALAAIKKVKESK